MRRAGAEGGQEVNPGIPMALQGNAYEYHGLGALLQKSRLPETVGQILLVATYLLEFHSVLPRMEHRFPLFNIASLYFLSAGCIPQ